MGTNVFVGEMQSGFLVEVYIFLYRLYIMEQPREIPREIPQQVQIAIQKLDTLAQYLTSPEFNKYIQTPNILNQ